MADMIHEFTVVLDRSLTDEDYDALFDAGLDDTTPGMEGGRGVLHVARSAPTLTDALVTVVADASRAGFQVVAVEEEDLVSLRTLAVRLGRSYESVRLIAQGKRGPGGFPAPRSGDGWVLYSWIEVSQWFAQHYKTQNVSLEHDRIVAAAGHVFRARTLVGGPTLDRLAGLAHAS